MCGRCACGSRRGTSTRSTSAAEQKPNTDVLAVGMVDTSIMVVEMTIAVFLAFLHAITAQRSMSRTRRDDRYGAAFFLLLQRLLEIDDDKHFAGSCWWQTISYLPTLSWR